VQTEREREKGPKRIDKQYPSINILGKKVKAFYFPRRDEKAKGDKVQSAVVFIPKIGLFPPTAVYRFFFLGC
jgi:hypothetical protein